MLKLPPLKGRDWAHDVVAGVGEQSVVVAATNAAGLVLPRLAAQLTTYVGSARKSPRSLNI